MQAWSYSALSSFETCPMKHWWTRAAPKGQRIVEPESEHQRYGKYVHSALENYAKTGTPLPVDLQYIGPVVDRLKAYGDLKAEEEYALTDAFNRVEWFAKDVWFRMKLDVLVLKPDHAVVLDYKTGKQNDNWDQLALAGAVLMVIHPTLTHVKMGYVWVQDKQMPTRVITKRVGREVLAKSIAHLQPYQLAFQSNNFPPKKNGLCRRHCPVTQCPHHGK